MKIIILLLMVFITMNLIANLDFGKDLFDDELYEEAINEFEKIIAESPTSNEAQEAIFYIGESYRERKQFARAENSYRKLIEGYPGNTFRDKVLHFLMLVQYEQAKYEEAIKICEQMLNKYPLSKFTQSSLSLYLQSIYNIGEYNRVIVKGRKIVKNYEDYTNIPDVQLIMAKAFFTANIPEEGRKTLNKIISEYPDHDARWQAVELEIELLENSEGIVKAAEELAQKITEDVPRHFEESLRLKLAEYYHELKKYDLAYLELEKLINKFDSSEDLDKYIIFYSSCQLKLNKFSEVIDDHFNFRKVFRESPLKAEYLLNLARAHFMLNDPEKAREIIEDARAATTKDTNLFECDKLSADILLKNGQLTNAIESYKKLLYSPFARTDELLFLLGDIYVEYFSQYSTAIKYYQRIITGYSTPEYYNKAYYKIALCYENMNMYNEAISELEQINPDEITDAEFRNKIEHKKRYLKEFKQQDYETAFNKLVESLAEFFENEDKNLLQEDLIDIMSSDLKEYEKATGMINLENNPKGYYQRAKLFLINAEKKRAEAKYIQAEECVQKADLLISKLDKDEHEEWITEVNLKKELIKDEKTTSETIVKLEEFVKKFPGSFASNEFALGIGNYYQAQNNMAKAAEYFEKLINYSEINDDDFYKAKLGLAEYYYSKNEDANALRNYKVADHYINLKQPKILFHYAVVLKESGEIDKAKEKLAFLLNNSDYFDDYDSAVNYFCDILKKSGEYKTIVKYRLLLPAKKRKDDFYLTLAEDYLQIEDKEKAKEALMHIVEKSYDTLFNLGMLQFETGEYEIAKYTFGELSQKNKKDLKNYEMLGKIAFIQEEFLEAAVNYKKIIDKLGDNFTGYEGINKIAKENIIALYRIANRPKAETLTSNFKKLFTSEEINEIELNRAIYQIKLNKKKAESIFSKLVKGKNVTNDARIKAYFWRGVVRLELEKLEEAKSDFTTVANSIDEEMSNQAHLKLGTINFSQEKYQEALGHYYKVIENDQDGELAFDAARNFAFVCKTIEEWQKAIAAYQIILERWGDQELEANTIFDIAFCHFRDKKYANAAEMFSRSIPLLNDAETQAEAQYWIGESYFGMDQYETAVSEFLKVGYNYPDFAHWAASAELKAGESYQNMKKIEKASRIYERIIDKYGRYSQWGTEAAKRLENL